MRVLNKKYWPYQHKFSSDTSKNIQLDQLERFCYDNFKSSDWRNDGHYFAFKKDPDYTFFMLRWA